MATPKASSMLPDQRKMTWGIQELSLDMFMAKNWKTQICLQLNMHPQYVKWWYSHQKVE